MKAQEVKATCDAAIEAIVSLPEDQRLAWLGYIAKGLSVREEQSNLVSSPPVTLEEREDLSDAALTRLRRALAMHAAERSGEVVHLPWDIERAGDAVDVKGRCFEFWVDSTAAAKGESWEHYGGQAVLSDISDPLSIIESSCQCKDYQAQRAYHNGVVVCKHVFWATIKVAHGQYQRLQQIEIYHDWGEVLSVKFNGCKLREAKADIEVFEEGVLRSGFTVVDFPGHGRNVSLDDKGKKYMRVYVR